MSSSGWEEAGSECRCSGGTVDLTFEVLSLFYALSIEMYGCIVLVDSTAGNQWWGMSVARGFPNGLARWGQSTKTGGGGQQLTQYVQDGGCLSFRGRSQQTGREVSARVGGQEDTARSDCGRGHGGPFLSTLDAGDALYRWGRDLASSGINNPNKHIGPAHAVSQTAHARCLCFPGRVPSRAIFPQPQYPPSILVLISRRLGDMGKTFCYGRPFA